MKRSKHAYLIIAHHEFDVLQKLLSALDDERNDIYVHIDKKVKRLTELRCDASRLILIEKRVDVRWGHVSQIKSEYALFRSAFSSGNRYDRFHVISGTHMPLKGQDEIHSFFDRIGDKEVVNYLYTNDYEVGFKLHRYHLFLQNYRSDSAVKSKIAQSLWHLTVKAQQILGLRRKEPDVRMKANNWVSLTPSAVSCILDHEEQILSLFRYSFCGDEFFVPYLLGLKPEKFKMIDEKRLVFNDFVGSTPRTITNDDFDFLIQSDFLFARKFTSQQMEVVDRILNHLERAKKL